MNRTNQPFRPARSSALALLALGIMACDVPSFAAVHAPAAASAPAGPAGPKKALPKKVAPAPIDVNSASREQLKTLPGIGDAQADRIVAGRPYLSKAELVTAKAIPAGTYLAIKRSIIAKPPNKPKGSR